MPKGSTGSGRFWGECLNWIVKSFVTPLIITPGRPHTRPGPWSRPGTTVYVLGCDVICVPEERPAGAAQPETHIRDQTPVVATRVLL